MHRRPSRTPKHPITPAKAHERALKAWRTKHLRYTYGIGLHKAVYRDPDDPDDSDSHEVGGRYFHDLGDRDEVKEEMDAEEAALAEKLKAEGIEWDGWQGKQKKRNERNQRNMKESRELDQRVEAVKEAAKNQTQGPDEAPFIILRGQGHPPEGHKVSINHETYIYWKGAYRKRNGDPDDYIVPHYKTEEEDWDAIRRSTKAAHEMKYGEQETPMPPLKPVIVVIDDEKFPKAPASRQEMQEIRALNEKKEAQKRIELQERFKKNRKGAKFEDYRKTHKEAQEDGYWRAQHEESKLMAKRFQENYTEGRIHKERKSDLGELGFAPGDKNTYYTNRWERVNKDDQRQSELQFTVNDMPQVVRGFNEEGAPIEYGQNLTDMLKEHGIHVSPDQIERVDDDLGGYTYKVKMEEGQLVNPAQAKAFANEVDKKYGLVRDKEMNPYFERSGPDMRRKRISVYSHEDTPEWVNPDTFDEERKLRVAPTGRIEGHVGFRDEYGNLREGEHDALKVRVKLPGQSNDQHVFLNLQDRTDAIGWGTSWRPGEKEVSDVLLAGSRYNQQQRLAEAYDAYQNGDETQINELVAKQVPDAADEEEIKHWRNEMLDAGAAIGASGVYTARKTAKTHGVHRTLNRYAPRQYNWLMDRGILPAFEHAYVKPAGQRLDRGLWRVAHPLHDPMRPRVAPIELNLAPSLPSITYRKRYHPKDWKEQAKAENMDVARWQTERRKDAETIEVAHTRHRIRLAMEGHKIDRHGNKVPIGSKERWLVLHSSDTTLAKGDDMNFDERWSALNSDPKRVQRLTQNAEKTEKMQASLKDIDPTINRTALTNIKQDSKVVGPHDLRYLKVAGKAGMYGVGGLAVLGAGVYAYDKHKEHQIQKGTAPNRSMKERIPETIKIPRSEWYASRKYDVPTNIWTDALDIEGSEVPYAWGVRNNPKVIRLRNHKDISGEGYKSAPLVGNVRGAGVANDGSWANSIAYKQREEGAGKYMQTASSTKNRYNLEVAGKQTPIYLQVGDKERWGKKDLKTANPNKLDQKDREEIAAVIVLGGPQSKELERYYGDDQRIIDMVKNERERIADALTDSGVNYRPGPAMKHNQRAYQFWDSKTTMGYDIRPPQPGQPIGEVSGDTPWMELSPSERAAREREYREQVIREQAALHGVFGKTVDDYQDERRRARNEPTPWGSTMSMNPDYDPYG